MRDFREQIVREVESLALEAESATKPLEIEPYRGRLFQLFVRASKTGLLDVNVEEDLSGETLGRLLGERWNLASVARRSVESQSKIDAESLGRMRLMWSVMRMWIEWSYAWERWPEFHQGKETRTAQ